jgi:hypothetical protein
MIAIDEADAAEKECRWAQADMHWIAKEMWTGKRS